MVEDPKQKRRNRIAKKLEDKRFRQRVVDSKKRYVRKDKYDQLHRTTTESLSDD